VSQFDVSWKRFASNDDGGIAILFALTMVPVLGIMGGAIDYGRAFAER
jgi:Flp pilus assembly protein TadG